MVLIWLHECEGKEGLGTFMQINFSLLLVLQFLLPATFTPEDLSGFQPFYLESEVVELSFSSCGQDPFKSLPVPEAWGPWTRSVVANLACATGVCL